jgi:hypothetical protein
MREEAMLTGENEETWQEADETAIVFDNGGGQIVAGDLARTPPRAVKAWM